MGEPTVSLSVYIAEALRACPPLARYATPWHMAAHAADVVRALLPTLGAEFVVTEEVAVHRTANVEAGAVIRGPAILGRNCAVAAHAYLRDGVFLDERVRIGPSCEVKSSFLFRGAVLAHLNYAGNSLIGGAVNVEAGAVLANHWNERDGKEIAVMLADYRVMTGVEKFGALLGDGVRIGANAVTAPGTLLPPQSVVGRLTLVDQVAQHEARQRDAAAVESHSH
jgi:UDP-N-acetylglucosamine diphosphorylase / glucose-1-phosphate thymidylyltransferase / UDP-N-acetylgalactosamine diphosphorylase / glucosamine-1-phosphate N-acetyltransferase / galactosamine-1-phosphate N-acetyltransferase